MSLQSRLGYLLIPLLGAHALVNRVMPVILDGGSSGVGLGYVAHGFARSPVFWNTFYAAFVTASVWHIVGGWAAWMGWKVTTVRKERGKPGSIEYGLGQTQDSLVAKKQKKSRWLVSGTIAVGTAVWLAGALGIIGRGGQGSGWEASGWNKIYSQVSVIGAWL